MKIQTKRKTERMWLLLIERTYQLAAFLAYFSWLMLFSFGGANILSFIFGFENLFTTFGYMLLFEFFTAAALLVFNRTKKKDKNIETYFDENDESNYVPLSNLTNTGLNWHPKPSIYPFDNVLFYEQNIIRKQFAPFHEPEEDDLEKLRFNEYVQLLINREKTTQ